MSSAILTNHFHQILRLRPDAAVTWDATEVARHWLMICPKRTGRGGEAPEPKQNEINSIGNDQLKLKQIRRRLSDISWWMRLLCQKVAQKANREDEIPGRFWEARCQSVKILDETGLLACAAYVDLNLTPANGNAAFMRMIPCVSAYLTGRLKPPSSA